MKLHHVATALVLVLGLVVTARAADKKDVDKEKLLGKWECTDGPERLIGCTVEILKDGKGKVTHKNKDGKEVTEDFTYAIDGDSVKVTHKGEGGKDVTSAYKVLSLTDKEMLGQDDKCEYAKFKRK
jgi:uncharacterized protein (TIGR03066 family)